MFRRYASDGSGQEFRKRLDFLSTVHAVLANPTLKTREVGSPLVFPVTNEL